MVAGPRNQLVSVKLDSQFRAKVRRLGLVGEHQDAIRSVPPTPSLSIVRAPEGEETSFASAVISVTHANGSDRGPNQIYRGLGSLWRSRSKPTWPSRCQLSVTQIILGLGCSYLSPFYDNLRLRYTNSRQQRRHRQTALG
jgi:hypothetical protein